ncbi:hypothetical protein C8N35_102487 [Breoghania corrubedonensis]|uniref:Flagellar motility protein MotE (MotC chaperone) n=1 Tax=Breoghania corrubedonensis TaxID=665038 RepID=A0A2T5VDD7_9HYPH|nr:hypothetical protein [Breoghania corrubedonensis]PTW61771.1 hypothetical protein C8N35_102487 [Breoghania corrubedonensis]
MNKLRLLHLVFLATGALLVFKSIGIVTMSGFALSPVLEASAQGADAAAPAAGDGAQTQPDASVPGDGPQPGAPSAAPSPAPAGDQGQGADAGSLPLPGENGMGNGKLPADGTVIQGNDLGRSRSERVVLERLRARRKELDEREARQQLREDLLKAAEARIEKRVGELKQLEARIGTAVDEKKKKEEEEFKNLARMYESMRAKDAARIFDRLDLNVLVRVARAMKPAKVADVMAKMKPEVAERLTIELATGQNDGMAGSMGDLPKIRGN